MRASEWSAGVCCACIVIVAESYGCSPVAYAALASFSRCAGITIVVWCAVTYRRMRAKQGIAGFGSARIVIVAESHGCSPVAYTALASFSRCAGIAIVVCCAVTYRRMRAKEGIACSARALFRSVAESYGCSPVAYAALASFSRCAGIAIVVWCAVTYRRMRAKQG